MAVAFDTFASNGTGSGTSISSFNITLGSLTNGAVAVGIAFGVHIGSPSSVTVTVGGNAASLVSSTTQSSGFCNTQIWAIATGSATGNQAVVVSWTGTSSAYAMAISASGVDQTTPVIHGATYYPGFQGAYSLAITSAAANLSFDAAGYAASAPADLTGVTQTVISQANNTNVGISMSRATTPAASVTHAWDASPNWNSQSGADFLAAAGGGFTPFPRPRGESGGMHILGGGVNR